jgi:hypothetical protein
MIVHIREAWDVYQTAMAAMKLARAPTSAAMGLRDPREDLCKREGPIAAQKADKVSPAAVDDGAPPPTIKNKMRPQGG